MQRHRVAVRVVPALCPGRGPGLTESGSTLWTSPMVHRVAASIRPLCGLSRCRCCLDSDCHTLWTSLEAHRAVWMAALPTFADFRKILCWRVAEMLRKTKNPETFVSGFLRCGRDSNPRPHAWQACILTSWTTEPELLSYNLSRLRCKDKYYF